MGADEREQDFLPEGHIQECYSVEEATSVLYDIADEMGEAY